MAFPSKNNSKAEIQLEFIDKRLLDIETEHEILMDARQKLLSTKKPRRDLAIDRPPRTVNPISDKVWRATTVGLNELLQQLEDELANGPENVPNAPVAPTEEEDLLNQAEVAIDNALVSFRAVQASQLYVTRVVGRPDSCFLCQPLAMPLFHQAMLRCQWHQGQHQC